MSAVPMVAPYPDPMTPGHPVMMVADVVAAPYPVRLCRRGRGNEAAYRKS
jgi:hypothetical protein